MYYLASSLQPRGGAAYGACGIGQLFQLSDGVRYGCAPSIEGFAESSRSQLGQASREREKLCGKRFACPIVKQGSDESSRKEQEEASHRS